MVTAEALTRAYYEALDTGEYDSLTELLEPGFVQQRPDRTFDNRAAFITFMREERPMTDTTHELQAVLTDDTHAVARGTLFDSTGDPVFEFLDWFTRTPNGDRFRRLETFVQWLD